MSRKKHAVEVSKNNLPIEEHLSWHERGWVVQRFGWVLLFSIPILGALGFFGDGYLSNKKLNAAGITAQYEKYGRYEKEIKLEIKSAATSIKTISLPQSYLQHFSEVRLIPEPESNSQLQDVVVYHFNGSDNGLVTLYAIPQQTGQIKGFVQVNNSRFTLNHFIYP